jgi:hypothetical protein
MTVSSSEGCTHSAVTLLPSVIEWGPTASFDWPPNSKLAPCKHHSVMATEGIVESCAEPCKDIGLDVPYRHRVNLTVISADAGMA